MTLVSGEVFRSAEATKARLSSLQACEDVSVLGTLLVPRLAVGGSSSLASVAEVSPSATARSRRAESTLSCIVWPRARVGGLRTHPLLPLSRSLELSARLELVLRDEPPLWRTGVFPRGGGMGNICWTEDARCIRELIDSSWILVSILHVFVTRLAICSSINKEQRSSRCTLSQGMDAH